MSKLFSYRRPSEGWTPGVISDYGVSLRIPCPAVVVIHLFSLIRWRENLLQLRPVFEFQANTLQNYFFPTPTGQGGHRRTPTHIEPNKLYQLPQSELVELVQLHMEENSALRTENSELFGVRDTLLRDQEMLSRENERLLKKLEDVNS